MPALPRRLVAHPELHNLARTLAYQRHCQHALALGRREEAALQRDVEDLTAALRCITGL